MEGGGGSLAKAISILGDTVSRREPLTYILGSRCKDGVVLLGDRKVTNGTDVLYEDKIFMDRPPIVVGSSGVYALFEKFRSKIANYIEQHKSGPVEDFVNTIEKYTRELNVAYKEVLETRWSFDVLVALQTSNGAILQYVLPQGLAEPVRRYKAIGHGEPYGSVFLKRLWNDNMTMEQVAELGYFIIRYIEKFELDSTVGVGDGHPQVWLIPHSRDQEVKQINDAGTLKRFEDSSKKRIEQFSNEIGKLMSADS
jgi:20S proteasome alpha/beta subunit